MDNKNVSTISIQEGIDFLENQFIAKLDDNVQKIIDSYSKFSQQGILSSANIDDSIKEIKFKIRDLQHEFDQLAQKIKVSMSQSSENITTSRSNIENILRS